MIRSQVIFEWLVLVNGSKSEPDYIKIATQGNLEENDTNLLARDHLTAYAGFNCLIMIKLIRYYLCKLKLKVRGLEYHVFQV